MVVWVGVRSGGGAGEATARRTPTYSNPGEAELAAQIGKDASSQREEGDADRSVVILCPYDGQKQAVQSHLPGVPVHTIDSFQGREADVVVLSLVRTGESGAGFWRDERRVVVAFTRARTRTVVVFSDALLPLLSSEGEGEWSALAAVFPSNVLSAADTR